MDSWKQSNLQVVLIMCFVVEGFISSSTVIRVLKYKQPYQVYLHMCARSLSTDSQLLGYFITCKTSFLCQKACFNNTQSLIIACFSPFYIQLLTKMLLYFYKDISEEKCGDGNLQTVVVASIADSASSYILHPQASLTVSKKTTTR